MGLTFQQLPDHDKPLLFLGINDLRTAKAGPTQYSFLAEFMDNSYSSIPQSMRKHYHAWINLRFLPMFLPGSEWQNKQKLRDATFKGSRIKELAGANFQLFGNMQAVFRTDDGRRAVHCHGLGRVTDLAPSQHFRFGPHLLTADAHAYMIATSEIVRFYVAAFGAIFYELINSCNTAPKFEPEAILGNLVYLDRSGWIEHETYRVAPKAGMVDRASAAQLAMLMTDPELLRAIWFMARSLSTQINYDEDSALLGVFPRDGNSRLELAVGDPIDTVVNGEHLTKVTPVRKIRKDRRRFAFTKLVIEISDVRPASTFTTTRVEAGAVREVPLFGDDLAITENFPNNGKARTFGAFGPTFSDCFPGIADVILTVNYREAPGSGKQRRASIQQKKAAQQATLNAITDRVEGVTRFERVDRSYLPDHDIEQPAVEPKPFFPVVLPPGEVTIDYLPRQALGARLEAFSKTRAVLFQEGVLQPIFDNEGSDVEPLILPPRTWGSYAHSRKFGPRHIAVMRIPTEEGRTFYAIELGQLVPGEYVSMGVVGRKDGRALSNEELHGLLYNSCRLHHISTSRSMTIWPEGCSDLDATAIIHRPKLYMPMELRLAILTRIAGLSARGQWRSTVA